MSVYLHCILLPDSSKSIFSSPLRSSTTTPIPECYCSCAVVSFCYFVFEVCVFEWVIFCLDRESLDARLCGRCFWDGEAFEDFVYFQSEVVVVV
jgi:hypothetical protein